MRISVTSFVGIVVDLLVMDVLKVIFLVIFFCINVISVEYLRVCYYTNWSKNRTDFAFFIEHIDARLCSHIIFAYARLLGGRINYTQQSDEGEYLYPGTYRRLNILKRCNVKMKSLIAVGGQDTKTEDVVDMLSTKEKRKTFIDSAIAYVRKWEFDGLDLQFDYGKEYSFKEDDKKKLTILLQEFRLATGGEGLQEGASKMLLTLNMIGEKTYIENAYEVKEIGKYLDFVNLDSYNFHGPWESQTSHSSSLYSNIGESVDGLVNYLISEGLRNDLIVIGLALYGRCFKLSDKLKKDLKAPVSGECEPSAFIKEGSMRPYFEICLIKQKYPSYEYKWIKKEAVPYIVSGDMWIAYENIKSLRAKVDYLKKKKLRGWFIWDLSMDDFNGTGCGKGRFPLIRELNYALTRPIDMDCEVKVQGVYEHPTNCRMFFTCQDGNISVTHCPDGMYYNADEKSCIEEKYLTSDRRKYCRTSTAAKADWSWVMVLHLLLCSICSLKKNAH